MDKLKYIKLEQPDGSYSDSIPLAVDADHVDVNGSTLTNVLGNKADRTELNNVNNTLQGNIENEITSRQTKDADLQRQIDGLSSGSPKAVTSISEMTNTSKIYVNVTDGKWYYYNGSEWVVGGDYQAPQDSETVETIANSLIYKEGKNKYNRENNIANTCLSQYGTTYSTDVYFTSGKIDVSKLRGKTIYFSKNGVATNYFCLCSYKENNTLIERNGDWKNNYTIPENASYIRFSMGSDNINTNVQVEVDERTDYEEYYDPYYSTLTNDVKNYTTEKINELNLNEKINIINNSIDTNKTSYNNRNQDYIIPQIFEIGTIYQGNNANSNCRIRTTDYINPNNEFVDIYFNTNKFFKLVIVEYYTNGSYVTQYIVSPNSIFKGARYRKYKMFFEKYTDSSLSTEDTTPITNEIISEMINSVSIINNLELEEKENQKSVYDVPSYWKSHLNEKINLIKEELQNDGYNKVAFLFTSDVHYDNSFWRTPSLIKEIATKCGINDLILPGDMINENSDKNVVIERHLKVNRDLKEAIKNYMPAIGNHDDNWNGQQGKWNAIINDAEMYNYIFSKVENCVFGKTGKYYYKDDPIKKVRYIALDTHDNDYVFTDEETVEYKRYKISIEQLKWFANALNVPSDWIVIPFYHVPVFEESYENDTIFCELCEAYNTHSTFTIDNTNYDFTNNGKIVGVFCGHCHFDNIQTINNVKHISIDTDSLVVSSHEGHYNKYFRSTTEQIIDVVIVDKTNNKVDLIRIGAGNNRNFEF